MEAFPLHWPAGWPRHKGQQDSDRLFRGPSYQWDRVYRGLVQEVQRIGGERVIVSSNQPIRHDGLPYAQTRNIADTGVAIYFTRGGKQMVMAQDRFCSIIGNMRSLTLALDGLRQMERHGGGVMLERAFEGFAALPSPGSAHWSTILGVSPEATRAEIDAAYRRLARERHPDQGVRCVRCDVLFGLSRTMYEQRKRDGETFYCPNEHAQHWRETEADRLRKEVERLQQRIARKDEEIEADRRAMIASRGQITKLKKKLGVES